jgi:hypothetical protein
VGDVLDPFGRRDALLVADGQRLDEADLVDQHEPVGAGHIDAHRERRRADGHQDAEEEERDEDRRRS